MSIFNKKNTLNFRLLDKEINDLEENVLQIGKDDLSSKIKIGIKQKKNEEKEFRYKYKFNYKILEDDDDDLENDDEDNKNDEFNNNKQELFLSERYEYIPNQRERRKSISFQKLKRKNSSIKDINKIDIMQINEIDEIDEDDESDYELDIKEEEEEEEEKNIDNNIQNKNDNIVDEERYPLDEPINEPPLINMDLSDIELEEEELDELDINPNNNNQIIISNESSNENNLQFTEHILGHIKSPIDMITIGEKVYELCSKKDNLNERIDLSPLNTFRKKKDIKVNIFKLINMTSQYNQFSQTGTALLNDYLSNDQKDEVPTTMLIDNRDYRTNCSICFGTNKSKLIKIPICSKPSKDCQGMVIDTEEVGISSMDIFENFFILGHFDGSIQIMEDQKIIDKIKDIKSNIINIKFLKINKKKQKYEFIYSDSDGEVNYVKRAKSLIMSRNHNEQIDYNKEYPVYKICIFSKEKDLKNIKKKNILIALASLQNVSLNKIRPKTDKQKLAIIETPYCSIGDYIFDCDFGYGFEPIPELNPQNEKEKKSNVSFIEDRLINEGNEEKILFVVAFGKVIRLLEIKINLKYSVKIKEIGYYINDFPINRIGFITKSFLTLFDNQKNLKIINTFCFENKKFNETYSDTLNNIILYEKIDLKDVDILRQNNIYFNDLSENKKSFSFSNYLNSILIFEKNIFIITKKNFLLYKLLGWDEVINNLCQNEKYEEMMWLNTFLFGKNKKLLEIESEENKKEEYENILKESLYIFLIKGTKEVNQYKELRMFIEFCIDTGRFKDFYEAKNILTKRKLDNYLYEYTTDYILKGKFSDYLFDKKFLIDFINYYINKKEIVLLSKTLLKLSIDNLNSREIFKILEKNEIINPFIYAKIKEEHGNKNDYFKPIEYLYELFENRIEEEENKINENGNDNEKIKNDYYKLITKHDMNYYSDKALSCNDYLCHKILWYINKCLLNEEYPKGNPLPKDAFEITAKKILLFLTMDKIMEKILKFDSFSYFILLTKLFSEPKLYKLIESNIDKKIFPYKGLENFVELYLGKIPIENLSERYFFYQVKLFIDDKAKNFKNYYFIKYDFYEMMAMMCKKRKNISIFIDRGTMLDAIKYFINYEYSLEGEQSKNYYDPFDCHKIPNKRTILYKEFSEKIENNILYLLNCLQSNEDFFISDLDDIFILEGFKYHNKVRTNLYEYGRKYDKLYEVKYEEYKNKNPSISKEEKLKNFFNWINDTLKLTKKMDHIILKKEKKKENYHNNFKKFIKSKFAELSEVSIEYLSNLIEKWYSHGKEEIIFSLGESISDALKYVYLDKYISEQEQKGEKDSKYELYLLMKIELLIKNDHKEQIIKLLKKNDILCNKKIIENLVKNEVYDSAIYIYQKMGEIENCLKLTLAQIDKIYSGVQNSVLFYDEKINSDVISIKLDEIKKYLDIGLGVCRYLTEKKDYNLKDVESSWLKFLDQFYNFKNKLDYANENNKLGLKYKSKIYNSILEKVEQNLLENIEYILSKMNDCISLSYIVEVLSNKFKDKNFKEYSKMFIRMFFSTRKNEDIYKSINKILLSSLDENNKILLKEMKRGAFQHLNECNKCKKEICDNYELINVQSFKCGHIYHNSCCAIEGGKYTCFICRLKDEEDSAFTYMSNFVFKNNKNFQSEENKNENTINFGEPHKKEIQKNKILSKLRKIKENKNEKIRNFKESINILI